MFSDPTVRFIEVWHYYGYWNIFLGRKYDFHKKVGLAVRLVLYSAGVLAAIFKIATDGVESILNGSLIYVPLCIYAFVIPLILFIKRENLVNLLRDFDECWASLNDAGDQLIFDHYRRKTWKFIRMFHIAMLAQLFYYIALPIMYDVIFHYAFDILSKPFILTYPYSSYLGKNATWNGDYFAVVFCSVYLIVEIHLTLFGWLIMYVVIIGYCYPLFVITRGAIQNIRNSKNHSSFGDPTLRKAILAHSLLCKVNRDLKAFLGLPCVFQSIFTSLVLTLSVFTTMRSYELFIIVAYGLAVFLFGLASLLYCSLGQMLENESETLFVELYNLPWYRFSPQVRLDLNMMLRQARKPFTIDFHGKYKMNLENYMEILKSSYSFFTLLQTLASKA